MKNTYFLDSSAMIHLASRTKTHTNSFRITITLQKTVDPTSLQQAVNHITPRFPTIIAGIRKGIFQYSIIPVMSPPKVTPDTQPLAPMSNDEIKSCAIRFLHKENTISIEIFHALTDGYGGVTTLLTLVAEYLHIHYGVCITSTDRIMDPNVSPKNAELADDYQIYVPEDQKMPAYQRTWQIVNERLSDPTVTLTSKTFDSAIVHKIARKYDASITAFLSGLMLSSVLELEMRYSSDPKMVQIMIPVNLRKLFSSHSLRNFSLYALLHTQTNLPSPNISDLIQSCSKQLSAQNQTAYMASAVSATISPQNHFLYRFLPLPLKTLLLKWIHRFIGEQASCISLSNLGNIILPEEMQQWVCNIDFSLTPRIASPYNCGVVSYKNTLTIQFSRRCAEPELERIFFQKLNAEIQSFGFNNSQTKQKQIKNLSNL